MIPVWMILAVNMTLLLTIWVLRNIGRGTVYINNKVSDAGDYLMEQAGEKPKHDKEEVDEIINNLKRKKRT